MNVDSIVCGNWVCGKCVCEIVCNLVLEFVMICNFVFD